jgi:hypothetical protein
MGGNAEMKATNLIAAAPLMLKALKDVIEYLEDDIIKYFDNFSDVDDGQPNSEMKLMGATMQILDNIKTVVLRAELPDTAPDGMPYNRDD